MTLRDDLEEYKNASAEQKVVILRGEMIPLLVTIRTYTDSIRYRIGSSPQDIEGWTQKILDAVNDLEMLREILVDAPKQGE
jgi:hypothetical protein